jgi:short subunit dehydrogenase-like uncharacterized protein
MTTADDTESLAAATMSRVLIVGGYGNVGQRIARLLATDLGDRLFIGGRDIRHATRFAATLPDGVRARLIDTDDPETYGSALKDVVAVLMCLDTTELAFPHACVTRGIRYIDISASYEVIERLSFLRDLAAAHQATIVSSVGLAPGLTNLLAKACVKSTDTFVSSIAVHLLFGLGDHHGKAALARLVDRLHRAFEIGPRDARRKVRPFEEQSRMTFPPPFGERTTYRFDFSDQHTLPQTLGVPNVSTWTTYDRAALARLLARLGDLGVLRWMRFAAIRRLAVLLLSAIRGGSDRFAVAVSAMLVDESQTINATATGCNEVQATAVVAAETLRRVLRTTPAAGVFQLDELYELIDFEATLASNGIQISAPAPIRHPNNARSKTNRLSDRTANVRGVRR